MKLGRRTEFCLCECLTHEGIFVWKLFALRDGAPMMELAPVEREVGEIHGMYDVEVTRCVVAPTSVYEEFSDD